MTRGVLYVMDTVVNGLVKIGKTAPKNFSQRMYQLEHNGYYNVVGLKRRFAIEVDDYDEKEELLHTIFECGQVGNSELFAVNIEKVIQILSSFDGDIVYPKKTTKDEVFDQSVEQARREAEENAEQQIDEDEPEKSPSELAKIAYWKRFYEYVAKDKKMVELFGDISKRKDNANNYVSFSIGLGNDCRIDIIHRTKGNGSLIVQIWCRTDRYYPDLYDGKADIEKATASLSGSLEWDNKQENKTSRKVEVKKSCTGNDNDDFWWACSWIKALYPAIRNVLAADE